MIQLHKIVIKLAPTLTGVGLAGTFLIAFPGILFPDDRTLTIISFVILFFLICLIVGITLWVADAIWIRSFIKVRRMTISSKKLDTFSEFEHSAVPFYLMNSDLGFLYCLLHDDNVIINYDEKKQLEETYEFFMKEYYREFYRRLSESERKLFVGFLHELLRQIDRSIIDKDIEHTKSYLNLYTEYEEVLKREQRLREELQALVIGREE